MPLHNLEICHASEEITSRTFDFSISGCRSSFHVQRFTAEEMVSECFTVRLWLVSETEVAPGEVIQSQGRLRIGEGRYFHGIVNRFGMTGRKGRFFHYQASLVPSVWALSLNSDFRIFQEKTVVEVLDEVLSKRMPNLRREFRLMHKYEKRRYCTQFGESDGDFLSRLMEEEGIFYFFRHEEDDHILVVADNASAYTAIPGDDGIRYCPGDGMVAEGEVCTRVAFSRGVRAGFVTQTNYNFKRPSLDIAVKQKGENHQEHEVYDYPGNYVHPDRGRRLAKVRLEQIKTLEECAEGSSNCQRFMPGHTFALTGHDFSSVNRTYLLVTVAHHGSQGHVVGEEAGIGGDCSYSNDFLAIPAEVTLRPERKYLKPSVGGFHTAVVVGPPGEEIYADEYGRVKVQFHWDRQGQKSEKSSCWLRISQPWSGEAWGMICLPRVGDEVLVGFMNGDPDWPIVLGSLNNALSPALYSLPAHKSRSGIRTRSYPNGGRDNFHELRFEDRKGSEEIYLQSERDWNILVKNDKGQTVGRDEAHQVGKNRLKTVGGDQVEHVGGCHTENIGANRSISVGANHAEAVALNSAETVGLAKELSVGGVYQVSVVGAMNETVLGVKAEEVGLTKQVLVNSHMVERVAGNRAITVGEGFSATVKESATVKAKTIFLEADDEIILKAGGATISLKNGEIVVNGSAITQRASGEIVIKGARSSVN